MSLTIKKIKDSIRKEGGEIYNDVDKVPKTYNTKGKFLKQKNLCKIIMEKVDPLYDSEFWEEDNKKNQKHYNFKIFNKEKQIYFKRRNIINKVKVKNVDEDSSSNYIIKTIIDKTHPYHELLIGLVLNNLKGE